MKNWTYLGCMLLLAGCGPEPPRGWQPPPEDPGPISQYMWPLPAHLPVDADVLAVSAVLKCEPYTQNQESLTRYTCARRGEWRRPDKGARLAGIWVDPRYNYATDAEKQFDTFFWPAERPSTIAWVRKAGEPPRVRPVMTY